MNSSLAADINSLKYDHALLSHIVRQRIDMAVTAAMTSTLMALLAAFALRNLVLIESLATWFGLIVLAHCLRLVVVFRVKTNVVDLGVSQLRRLLNQLNFTIVLIQLATASGIWWVGGQDALMAEWIVTGLICVQLLFLINLLGDDKASFVHAAAGLMAQPLLFWLLKGQEGLVVVLLMTLTCLGSYAIVRSTSRGLCEAIKEQFSKNQLETDLSTSHRKIAEALIAAERANRQKAFFMAAVSHDLRQPLFALNMINDSLMLKEQTPETIKLLRIQQNSIKVMTSLFDNLLDLAQFYQGIFTVNPRQFSVRDLYATLKDDYSVLCGAKGIALSDDLPAVTVTSDFDLLQRLLRNLLDNALRHTDAGEIDITGVVENEILVVFVEDTGTGVTEQDHSRFFDDYVTQEKSTKSPDATTGLGLAIVRQIDDLLTLNLSIESEVGKGTRVRFSLPVIQKAV